MTVKLVHSNYKTEVEIYTSQVFAVLFLPQNQTTAVLAVGGAMVPVMGTVEEVKRLINEATKRSPKKEKK